MIDKYIQILIESLDKKKLVLQSIIEKNEEQVEQLKEETISLQQFDLLCDEKEQLITQLLQLDQGFEAIYNRIQEDLKHPAVQKNFELQIRQLQNQIKEITDLSVAIEVGENRNKNMVEKVFRNERDKLQNHKKSTKAAVNYYKSMNRVNYVDPQMLDQKQ